MYTLQQQRRKTMGIYIRSGRLVVRVPYRTPMSTIEYFLEQKSAWISQKLKEQAARQDQQKSIQWQEGASLRYLGQEVRLSLCTVSVGVVLQADGVLKVGQMRSARQRRTREVKELVQTWMREQALFLFQARAAYFSSLLDVCPEKITLTSAQTRWGSANSKKHIRLHWRLVQLPLDVIDYVVVHELAHLKEMNHGVQFWSLVGSVLPNYREQKSRLKTAQLPIW